MHSVPLSASLWFKKKKRMISHYVTYTLSSSTRERGDTLLGILAVGEAFIGCLRSPRFLNLCSTMRGWDSLSSSTAMITPTAPIPEDTKKGTRIPNSAKPLPTTGPIRKESVAMAPIPERYFGRSADGTKSVIQACATGAVAPKIPVMKRHASN